MILVSVVQAQIFFLSLTRVLAILIQIPMLGGNAIPTQVRIAFGLVLTIILVPWQTLPPATETIPLLAFAASILRELIIGVIAGYAANLTFGAISIAGEMISTSAGFSAGRILNPMLGDSTTSIDQLFVLFALALFLVIDGHHGFIAALKQTFDLIPVNTALPDFMANSLIKMTAQLIVLGIQMALPVVGTLLLTDITLGLLARVAPQIQVYFLGLPAKIALGLMAITLTLAVIMPKLIDTLRAIAPSMLKLLGS
jgi:flagellar biosynthetic protein FliR